MSSTVIVSNPFGGQSVRVQVNDVSRSWSVGASGSLSCEALTDDLVHNNLNGSLLGYWIEVEHDDAGHWGGVINDVQPMGDGTTEIAADGWRSLFSARELPDTGAEITGTAGAVAKRLLTETTRQYVIPIAGFTVADFGTSRTASVNGENLLNALDRLASDAGQGWWVDAETRTAQWGYRGNDLSGSIQLCAPRHIRDYQAPRSLDPITNSLTAYPLDATNQQMQSIVVQSPASIASVGIRESRVAIDQGPSAETIRPAAQSLVDSMARSGHTIEMDVFNIDRCWQWFREGDTICVLLPRDSARAVVKVMARSLSDRQDLMSVSCDVLDWTVL